MFPIDEQTAVLVAGACLAVVSALILIWRASSRSADTRQPAVRREEQASSKQAPAQQASPLPAAAPHAMSAPVVAAAKADSADDPYGVRATLPPGASYTAIAVAHAEAAARARAASGASSRA